MEHSLPLTDAYQRLLGELCRRMGADHAELLLYVEAEEVACIAASYNETDPTDLSYNWVDVPICEGALEVGRLRMAFLPDVPLPGPTEQSMTQSLVNLAALLVEEHHQLTWGPLRQAGRRILAVAEEELQRIILDIHDGPVQKLFAASSQIALLQSQIAQEDESLQRMFGSKLDQLGGLIESALQEIKTSLSTFRPSEFHRRSLPEVIQGLILQHQSLTGNSVDLYIEEDIPSVSLATKIALYRVLQEALSNAYRHAGVDQHEVRLGSQSGWVVLEVIDQGHGFTPPPLEGPSATEREEHIGLRGMRERMHLVGGQLRVYSEVGYGTRVVVKVPGDV